MERLNDNAEPIEAAEETLRAWLDLANKRIETPPVVEPIVGDGEFHVLNHCSLNTYDGELVLGYGDGEKVFGCTINPAFDGPQCIRFITDKQIEFECDGELGRIRRGKPLLRRQ